MKKFVAAAALALLPAASMAATWQYDLRGSKITECTVSRFPQDQPFCDAILGHSFDGSIFINESLLSRKSLISQTLVWHLVGYGELSLGEDPAALDIRLPSTIPRPGGDTVGFSYLEPRVHMEFRLVTDHRRRPVAWFLDLMHDGPDLILWDRGIWVDVPTADLAHAGVIARGTPGTLALIPLPPSALLLLGGLTALGAAGWRRTRPTSARQLRPSVPEGAP
jgi:hypothetical protein